MKMKRMEMRDVSIGEYQFKIRPFGAKDALYIFGDVASILLPILGSVAVASDDKDAVEMEMFDGVDLDTESLTKALGRINGKALSKLVSELIMEHSNVSYRDPDRGSYQPVTEDEFDEIFCQYLAGVFSLCAEIIKLNFSGFFFDLLLRFFYFSFSIELFLQSILIITASLIELRLISIELLERSIRLCLSLICGACKST